MVMFKDHEYTIDYDAGQVTLEDVVHVHEAGLVPLDARIIALDSDGLVFEWKTKMSNDDERDERERIAAAERAKAVKEFDDRKLGF